jgi:tRNA1Val (adenine37-N6)-methyltransferase
MMMQTITHDPFFNGQIVFKQPQTGYRFSIDAVVIAHWLRPTSAKTILDLGTGCGVIPVMLAYRHADIHAVGVEIQPDLAELARQNVVENRMADRIRIIEKDMRELSLREIGDPVEAVVANPPYRKLDSGRINADSQRAVARHELAIDLQRVLLTARRMLEKSGRFFIIYPSVRIVDLIAAMRSSELEPKILMMIHTRLASPARLVAMMGVKGGRPGIEIESPLYLYKSDGTYTEIVEAMLSG